MRESIRLIICTLLIPGIFSVGCSSSSNLRKFNDSDIAGAVSEAQAKKFEVRESAATPTPSPTPDPESKKKSKKKKHEAKVKKGEKVEPTPTPETKNTPPARKPEKMPFEIGEKLDYAIRYIGVTAGHFAIEVQPYKFVQDRQVYHLVGKATTVKIFELVYRVDDTVESYFDSSGLFSHRFTMDLDESKQTRKVIELYDYDKKQSMYWNRIDHVKNGYKEEKQNYDIELWSQDPLSSLYFLRLVQLPTDPSQPEYKFPVILDGKPWELRVKYKKREKIYAGGQVREADVYNMDSYQNGELKNRENTLWLSTDEHRYILRVEAKVKVGSFAVALDEIL